MFGKIKKEIKKRLTIVKPIYIETTIDECLNGRIALITGGGSGIGESIARKFVKSGAKVIITGRNEEKLRKVVSEIGTNAKYYVLDNRNINGYSEAFTEINSFFGNVDILVNNAGIIGNSSFPNINSEDFDSVIETNLKGPVFMAQEFVRNCLDHNLKGNILNVGSSSCLRPAISTYTLSKWGIRGFTLGLAKKCAPYGIVVNGIAPGPTATPILNQDGSNLANYDIPAGRFATAEEIASIAVQLVSGSGRMIMGDMVYMTGGAGNLTFDDMKY